MKGGTLGALQQLLSEAASEAEMWTGCSAEVEVCALDPRQCCGLPY